MPRQDQNTRETRSKVEKAVRRSNLAKSAGRMFLETGKSILETEMPASKSLYETNRELLNDAVRLLRNPTEQSARAISRVTDSDTFKNLRAIAKNMGDDLRSGNLYDPKRARSSMSQMMALESFGGMDMSKYDDKGNWIGDDEKPESDERDFSMRLAQAQEDAESYRAEVMVDALGNSTEALLTNQNANAQMTLQMSLKQHAQLMNQMDNMITTQAATFELISKSTQAQMDVAREAHLKTMEKMDKIIGLLEHIDHGVNPPVNTRRQGRELEVFRGGRGSGFDLRNYGKQIVKNFQESQLGFGMSMVTGMMGGGMGNMMLDSFKDNPWMELSKIVGGEVWKQLAPKSLQRQMKRTNENLENFFPALLNQFARRGKNAYRSDNKIDWLFNLLGVSNTSKSEINTMTQNMTDRAVFSNKTVRAIEEVIPMWLSRIDSHITGGPLQVFDYRSGRLVRADKVVAESGIRARNLSTNLGEAGNKLIKRGERINLGTAKQSEDFRDFLNLYLQRAAESDSFAEPGSEEFNRLINSINFSKGRATPAEMEIYRRVLTQLLRTMPRNERMAMDASLSGAHAARRRNVQYESQFLADSGLRGAFSFMSDIERKNLISEAEQWRNGLGEAGLDAYRLRQNNRINTMEGPDLARYLSSGGVSATNSLLADVRAMLRRGVITYSYDMGGADGALLMDSFRAASDAAASQSVFDKKLADAIRDASSGRGISSSEKDRKMREDYKKRTGRDYDADEQLRRRIQREASQKLHRDYIVDSMSPIEINGDMTNQQIFDEIFNMSKNLDPDNPLGRDAATRGQRVEYDGKDGIVAVLKRLAREPFRLFENGLRIADQTMFKILYGERTAGHLNLDDEDVNLTDYLTKTVQAHFVMARDWFSKNIGDPMKRFFFDKDTGLFTRVGQELKDLLHWDDRKRRAAETVFGTKDENGQYQGGWVSGAMNVVGDIGKESKGLTYARAKNGLDKFLYGAYVDDKGKREENSPTHGTTTTYSGFIGNIRRRFDEFGDMMFGSDDSKEKLEKVKRELRGSAPNMVIGAGTGLLTSLFIPGGPIFHSIVGATRGLIDGSENLTKMLFGDEVTETETRVDPVTGLSFTHDRKTRKGGKLGDKAWDVYSKYLPGMKKGLVAGAIAGGIGLLPFGIGPGLGAFIGSIGGLGASSSEFRRILFGDEDDVTGDSGIISKNMRDKIAAHLKKYAPPATLGFLAGKGVWSAVSSMGLLPGLTVAGPVMGILGGLVGLGSADRFQKMLFGEDVEREISEVDPKTGKRIVTKKKVKEGGLFGKAYDSIEKKMIDPLADKIKGLTERFSDWFKEDILDRLSRSAKGLQDKLKKAGSKIFGGLVNIGDKIAGKVVGKIFGDEEGRDGVSGFLKRRAKGLFNFGAKMVGGALSSPFKLLEFIATGKVEKRERKTRDKKTRVNPTLQDLTDADTELVALNQGNGYLAEILGTAKGILQSINRPTKPSDLQDLMQQRNGIEGPGDANAAGTDEIADFRNYARTYAKVDHDAEGAGDQGQAYDKAIANAKSMTEVIAIRDAASMNSNNRMLQVVGDPEKKTSILDMLGNLLNTFSGDGIFNTIKNAVLTIAGLRTATALAGGTATVGAAGAGAAAGSGLLSLPGNTGSLAAPESGLGMFSALAGTAVAANRGDGYRVAANIPKIGARMISYLSGAAGGLTTWLRSGGTASGTALRGGPALLNQAQKLITKFFSNKVVATALAKVTGKATAQEATSLVLGHVDDVIKTLSAAEIQNTARLIGKYFTIAMAVIDFIKGSYYAQNYFEVLPNDVTAGMTFAAGAGEAISGLLCGIISGKSIAGWLWDWLSPIEEREQLATKQETARQSYGEFLQSGGDSSKPWVNYSDYTMDDYLSYEKNQQVVNSSGFQRLIAHKTGTAERQHGRGRWGRGSNMMKVYSQDDMRWSNLAGDGCGPTAAAMVASAYGDTATPADMDALSRRMGMRANDGGTNPEFFGNLGRGRWGRGYYMNEGPVSEHAIRSNLNRNEPVVLMGKGGAFGPDEHYIVGRRIAGNSMQYADPYTGSFGVGNIRSIAKNTHNAIYSHSTGRGRWGRGPTTDPLLQYNVGKQTEAAANRAAAMNDPLYAHNVGVQRSLGVANSSDARARLDGVVVNDSNAEAAKIIEAQNALVNAMYSIKGRIQYSCKSSIQDPDRGIASCASTVGWAYRKVLNEMNMSASSAEQSKDGRFQDIYRFGQPGTAPGRTFDLSKLQPGDIVYMYNPKYKSNHTEMYVGNGIDMSHGGGTNGSQPGPNEVRLDENRQRCVFAVRRYKKFINGETFSYTDPGSFTGTTTVASSSPFGDDYSSLGFLGKLTRILQTANDALWGGTPDNDMSANAGSTGSTETVSGTKGSNISGTTNREKVWNYLRNKGLSAVATAGLMGNIYAESGIRPEAVQGDYRQKNRTAYDEKYRSKVDSGAISEHDFVHNGPGGGGYGLAQWTYHTRKQELYDLKKSTGSSIADVGLQLDHLWNELNKPSYKDSVLGAIKGAGTVKQASDIVLHNFEQPKNQSAAVENTRASYGQQIYDALKTLGSDADATANAREVSEAAGYNGSAGDFKRLEYGGGRRWGRGHDTTNLNSLNMRVREINDQFEQARTEAKDQSTAEEITKAITGAVSQATTGGNSEAMLSLLTTSLGQMIQLLSDIKDNTTADTRTSAIGGRSSAVPTSRADDFSSTFNMDVSGQAGSKIIDQLTTR